jgi:hypothetical protein
MEKANLLAEAKHDRLRYLPLASVLYGSEDAPQPGTAANQRALSQLN